MKRRTRRFWKRTGDGVEPDDSRLPTHVTVLGALLASSSFFWNLACGAGSSGALTPPPTVLPPTLAKSFGSATSSLQVDTCVRVQFATVDSNYGPVQTPPADAYEGVGIPSPRERCSELPEVFTRRRPRSGRQDQNQDRSLQHIKTRRRSECHPQTTQSQS